MADQQQCRFCGELIESSGQICKHCNKAVSRLSVPPSSSQAAKKKPIPPFLLIAVGLVIIVGIIALLSVLLNRGDQVTSGSGESPQSGKQQNVPQSSSSDMIQIEYEGVRFVYHESLNWVVKKEVVPATDHDDWFAYPKHIRITLAETQNQGQLYPGFLDVYPADLYAGINDYAAEVIGQLRGIINNEDHYSPESALPFLPELNAAQLFHSNFKPLRFLDGQGVRFLTQHGQDISPIVNEALIYTFQGLTEDGMYYVSIVIPVKHPGIVEDWESFFAETDYSEFEPNFLNYLERDRNLLENSPDSVFTPDLSMLDQMAASIKIGNPAFLYSK